MYIIHQVNYSNIKTSCTMTDQSALRLSLSDTIILSMQEFKCNAKIFLAFTMHNNEIPVLGHAIITPEPLNLLEHHTLLIISSIGEGE